MTNCIAKFEKKNVCKLKNAHFLAFFGAFGFYRIFQPETSIFTELTHEWIQKNITTILDSQNWVTRSINSPVLARFTQKTECIPKQNYKFYVPQRIYKFPSNFIPRNFNLNI